MEFTPSIVRDAIKSLKPSLGSGYDGIPINLIEYRLTDIPILLTKIFNLPLD